LVSKHGPGNTALVEKAIDKNKERDNIRGTALRLRRVVKLLLQRNLRQTYQFRKQQVTNLQ